MSEPVRIGLLGRGTVGGAFAELVAARAGAVEAATGRRPEIAGVLTRGEGDFEAILERSDLIVELIGGTDPARDYVLEALRAGRPVVTANKQLLAQHGEELFDVAREAGVQLRFEAAVAGVIPIVRVIQESFGVTEIAKVFGIVNGTTNFILTEMAASGAPFEQVLARAQELGYAESDPSADVNGADAAAKMAILARLAFHTPVTLEEVAYEGIEQVKPDDIAYAKELGLSLKLLGVAERRESGISVRVFPCFLYSGHPLAPVEGPFNAVMVEAPEITEVTMSGPGAGGVQTASAVLGDVVSVLSGDAPVHETRQRLPIVTDIASSFYLHLAVADRPGVLAQVAQVLGDEDVSVKSVVQRGAGDDARLVMVVHKCLESRFAAALEAIDRLDVLRSPPRAIRVIEEEFV
jgi:homoserine dehydrogenase